MPEAPSRPPVPSATGSLETTPLAHALVYARNRRLTGLFELSAPGGRSGAMLFWRGRITAARTTPPVAYFGAVAYELGYIDTPTLDATLLEIATTKRLHGEVLVARGALTTTRRDEILVEQACRKVHHLFSFPLASTFAFYESVPAEAEPPVLVDPLAPAWRGLRDCPPDAPMREVLARYALATLSLVSDAPLVSAGLGADEAALCTALLERPMTLGQLRASTSLTSPRVELLAYLLLISKCLVPVAPVVKAPSTSLPAAARIPSTSLPAAASPPSTTLPAAASPPSTTLPAAARPPSTTLPAAARPPSTTLPAAHSSLSFKVPTAPAFSRAGVPAAPVNVTVAEASLGPDNLGLEGIVARAATVEREDYFAVLGLPEGASGEAVRSAHFRLAKVWHPDRLAPGLREGATAVSKIFGHMTLAHRTLTDPQARREWLAKRAPTPVKKPREQALRDIDQALLRREFASAEEQARLLATYEPDDTEIRALVVWTGTSGGGASEEVLRAALASLDRAVSEDRYCERALYYRGLLHKRLGNGPAALRDFMRVAQLDPKHIEAQREVRLSEMRARKGSGELVLGALVSKVTGKK